MEEGKFLPFPVDFSSPLTKMSNTTGRGKKRANSLSADDLVPRPEPKRAHLDATLERLCAAHGKYNYPPELLGGGDAQFPHSIVLYILRNELPTKIAQHPDYNESKHGRTFWATMTLIHIVSHCDWARQQLIAFVKKASPLTSALRHRVFAAVHRLGIISKYYQEHPLVSAEEFSNFWLSVGTELTVGAAVALHDERDEIVVGGRTQCNPVDKNAPRILHEDYMCAGEGDFPTWAIEVGEELELSKLEVLEDLDMSIQIDEESEVDAMLSDWPVVFRVHALGNLDRYRKVRPAIITYGSVEGRIVFGLDTGFLPIPWACFDGSYTAPVGDWRLDAREESTYRLPRPDHFWQFATRDSKYLATKRRRLQNIASSRCNNE